MGAAWPIIYKEINVLIAYAGIYSMIVSAGTVFSSLLSSKIIKILGTGTVSALSVILTAIGLIGITFSETFIIICIFAVLLGIGAGSIDSALNNFVALHYK